MIHVGICECTYFEYDNIVYISGFTEDDTLTCYKGSSTSDR